MWYLSQGVVRRSQLPVIHVPDRDIKYILANLGAEHSEHMYFCYICDIRATSPGHLLEHVQSYHTSVEFTFVSLNALKCSVVPGVGPRVLLPVKWTKKILLEYGRRLVNRVQNAKQWVFERDLVEIAKPKEFINQFESGLNIYWSTIFA